MCKLKVDKKGFIKRQNGSILGVPKKTGNVYRGTTITGRIDLSNGNVYNKKDVLLGTVDIHAWGDLFEKAILKLNTAREKGEVTDNSEKLNNSQIAQVLYQKRADNAYCPGKDPKLIVPGILGRILWPKKYERDTCKALAEINSANNWDYWNWYQLVAKENLDEKIIDKYSKYINWYVLTHFHQDKVYSEEFTKKYAKQLATESI